MANIPLTAGMKSNLLQLQGSQKLFEQTQERMTTGKKVNKPSDDPAAYYAAATLTDRAGDLESRLDGMGQAVQAIKAADNGIEAMRSVLDNMKAVVENALTTEVDDGSTRDAMGKKFNELLVQLDSFARDSAYGGINLLIDEQTIDVQLGQGFDDSVFRVTGFHIAGATGVSDGEVGSLGTRAGWDNGEWSGASGYSIENFAFAINRVEATDSFYGIKSYGVDNTGATGHEINWGDTSSTNYRIDLKNTLESIELVDEELKKRSQLFSFDQSTITLREEYTKEFVNALESGSDKLTLADLNEEAANLLAVQTSQQLGVQTLSLSNQQTQSVLRILG